MTFPNDFPEHSQSAVIAARVRVAARTENELGYLPRSGARELAALGRSYVMQVFAVFAKEACALGMERSWSTRQIDVAAMEFMRQLAIDARSEYSHLGVPSMVGSLGHIDTATMHQFKLSDEWKVYQDALLKVAELQAQEAPERTTTAPDRIEEEFTKIRRLIPGDQAIVPHVSARSEEPVTVLESNAKLSQAANERSIGEQISDLFDECELTVEELAELVELDPTNVSRHIQGKSIPTIKNQRRYQEQFSKVLKRKVVISKTPRNAGKRS